MHHRYVIVGGGVAGDAAIEGIRAHDPDGSILLVTRENHLPYHRPPLSKDLWFGKKKKDEIAVRDPSFYRERKVEVSLRREIVELDPQSRTLWDDRSVAIPYDRLLLATGGHPRLLGVEGADHESVRYFRSLEDYLALEERLPRLQHVLVVGGGFISIELAAAMRHVGMEVTFLFPHDYPLQRVMPREIGEYVAEYYRDRGIETVSNDAIVGFEDQAGLTLVRTRLGNFITTQLVLVGIGIEPQVELAEAAGLAVGDGIEVDEFARTSDPNVFAAGDVAEFPYLALGQRTRIEHWDHAIQHGRAAGANMAGADKPYTTLPMFFSDFFDLGWEAVGEVNSSLDVHPVWKEPFREGVLFYTQDDVIRGVLMWNVWERLDWARKLIEEGKSTSAEERVAMAGMEA